jgi:hypothetical protein
VRKIKLKLFGKMLRYFNLRNIKIMCRLQTLRGVIHFCLWQKNSLERDNFKDGERSGKVILKFVL